MSLSLVLNSNNVVNNGLNSQYQYNFINGAFNVPPNSTMCISNVTIPYSWFNLNSSLYNNVSFQYTFPNASGQPTYTVTIPNGYYDVNDINNYLQSVMIKNKQYLVNANGQYVYYLTMTYNVTYYAVQVVCYNVPTSLPSGWTNPSSMTFPTTTLTPQLIVSNSNQFGSVIGFTAGTYPAVPATVTESFLSNTIPDGSPVNSLIMRCNLVDNNVAMPSDIVDSIPISDATFGANITYQPNFPKWVKLKAGKYSYMNVQLVDQNNVAIVAKDNNVLITLLLQLGTSSSIK